MINEDQNSGSSTVAAPADPVAIPGQAAEIGGLFTPDEAAGLREQWNAIQISFVDEPRHAVEEADSLVALAIKRLAEQFSVERSNLGGQQTNGHEVSTEDLRLALRRYRSFLGRLLSV